mgnify:CR=1 FL=1
MYFVVLGPRRSGTNYLSELILCNTNSDSYKIANLDSKEISRNLNERIIKLNHILGSKHSLTDVPIEKKISPDNINIFIARRDFSLWVNSIANYKRKFIENFIFNEKELDFLFNQYLDYFKVLNDFANSSNYIVIFHEDLSSKKLYKIAEKLNFQIKKNIKEINYKISPGGYRRRFSIFKNKVMKYDNKSLESKLVKEKYGRYIGDQYDPVKFLNNHGVKTNNLPIFNL